MFLSFTAKRNTSMKEYNDPSSSSFKKSKTTKKKKKKTKGAAVRMSSSSSSSDGESAEFMKSLSPHQVLAFLEHGSSVDRTHTFNTLQNLRNSQTLPPHDDDDDGSCL